MSQVLGLNCFSHSCFSVFKWQNQVQTPTRFLQFTYPDAEPVAKAERHHRTELRKSTITLLEVTKCDKWRSL
jgi:hypothetical protein